MDSSGVRREGGRVRGEEAVKEDEKEEEEEE